MGPRSYSVRRVRSVLFAAALLGSSLLCRPARASSPAEPVLDATALQDLEQRADAAQPRDRCYLYSELLHGWTELAGRSMAGGDDTAASAALVHADADALKLKIALENDSKRLKNAELLLEHTVRRLSDMVRVATMDQHDSLQAVLKHMNNVHDALLAQIFAH